jgi:hypothetical protein
MRTITKGGRLTMWRMSYSKGDRRNREVRWVPRVYSRN